MTCCGVSAALPAEVCASAASHTGQPSAIARRQVVSTQNSVCMPQMTSASMRRSFSSACSSVWLKLSGVALRRRTSPDSAISPSASCHSRLPWRNSFCASCWMKTTGAPAARAAALKALMRVMVPAPSNAAPAPSHRPCCTSMMSSAGWVMFGIKSAASACLCCANSY